MLSQSELEAILYLLEDTDEEVVKTVENRLYTEGLDILPQLENYWETNKDPVLGQRIETIIHEIQHSQLADDFRIWRDTGGVDLLEASILVSRIQYPGMHEDVVYNYIDKVRLDAWMAMYNAHNPLDKVKILNHILFERFGLTGNSENYHAPDNSFIHKLIESRSANPITMCNLYACIAQRLGMPVFGVNLPQHFVLAWCEELKPELPVPFNSPPNLNRQDYGNVLFYINPFSKGQIFLKKNIDEFLGAIKVEPRPEFFQPCETIEILKRMVRNLHFSYTEIQNNDKVKEIEKYMKILGMTEDSELEEP